MIVIRKPAKRSQTRSASTDAGFWGEYLEEEVPKEDMFKFYIVHRFKMLPFVK